MTRSIVIIIVIIVVILMSAFSETITHGGERHPFGRIVKIDIGVRLLVPGADAQRAPLAAEGPEPREDPHGLEGLVLPFLAENRVLLIVRVFPTGHGEVLVSNAAGKPSSYVGTTRGGLGAVGVLSTRNTPVGVLAAGPQGNGGLWTSTADGGQIYYVGADLRGNGRIPQQVKPGKRL